MSAEPVAGFTPAPDCIRDDIDALAALVFGAVWRFGRQTSGTCTASVEKIAERAGIGTTATRIRLAQLAENGWIIAKTRVGQPTVYRDAGRWTMTLVGQEVPQTPSANVGVPQRQTLGYDVTSTANVGVPQREALPKIHSKIQEEGAAATAAARAAKWRNVYLAVADSFGGVPVMKANGQPLAWVGQIAGVAGRACDDDPVRSEAFWRQYADSPDFAFSGNGDTRTVMAFGKWAKKNAPAPAPRSDPRGSFQAAALAAGVDPIDPTRWPDDFAARWTDVAAQLGRVVRVAS